MLTILLLGTALTLISVLIHYEAIYRLSQFCRRFRFRGRWVLLLGVVWIFVAHVIEVWVFGIGLHLATTYIPGNSIAGAVSAEPTFFDSIYFSFSCYTSLGFGDIFAQGPIRFLVATESLLGLLMIAWTASFLYLEMIKYWETDSDVVKTNDEQK